MVDENEGPRGCGSRAEAEHCCAGLVRASERLRVRLSHYRRRPMQYRRALAGIVLVHSEAHSAVLTYGAITTSRASILSVFCILTTQPPARTVCGSPPRWRRFQQMNDTRRTTPRQFYLEHFRETIGIESFNLWDYNSAFRVRQVPDFVLLFRIIALEALYVINSRNL